MANVLIVDDVEMFRSVVAHALKGAGHNPVCAPDGEAGLAVLETTPVDLVLLDMAMPKMNGADFLKRLRADPRFAALPVVVVSAMSRLPHETSVTALGAQAQLLKSRFSLRELIRHVNELLNVTA
jgi:CheY-like chemotaxis protein